jgi:type VI secretion system protein VasG
VPDGSRLADLVRPELLRHFKAAFLGRLTIVPYLPLSEVALYDIVRLQLSGVVDRLFETHQIELTVKPEVESRIVARCLAADIGARAVEGILNREILPLISTSVLEHVLGGSVGQRFVLTSGPGDGFCMAAELEGRTRASAGARARAEAAIESS